MTTKRRNFPKGIKLKPDTTALTEEGEVKYDDTAKKVQYRDDSADRSVVSEDGTQTLENKTMDFTSATGNNTITADSNDIAYDNAASGMTATNVKDALDEIDTRLEGQDEASEISYDNSTSGLTATDVQAAIDEVEGRVDTAETDITALDGRVTTNEGNITTNDGRLDAIEAATYVNSFNTRTGAVVPAASDYDADQVDYDNTTSGLTATNVQAGIDELENEIDTVETSISDHVSASSDVHGIGVGSDVVGTNTTQTVQNKTISASKVGGGTASATNKVVASSETTANLTAITREKGSLYFDDDQEKLVVDNGTQLIPVGSGSGSLDIFFQEDFEVTAAADFTSGNNATVDGGGSLAGTLADESASPISGDESVKYTQAAGSLNDYILSPVIAIEDKQQGNLAKVTVYTTYSGDDDDIKFFVYDDTNNDIIGEVNIKASTVPTRNEFSFTVPESASNLKYGFQTLVANDTEELVFDDVELSLNPFLSVKLVETAGIASNQSGGTSGNVFIPTLTSPYYSTDNISDYISINGSTGVVTVLKRAHFTLAWTTRDTSAGTQATIRGNFGSGNNALSLDEGSTSTRSSATWAGIFEVGNTFQFEFNVALTNQEWGISVIEVQDQSIVTPVKYEEPETNLLTADFTSNAVMTDLTFTDLVIGQLYRFTLHARINTDNADVVNIEIENGTGNSVGFIQAGESGNATNQACSDTGVFRATDTTLTFTAGSIAGSSSIRGANDRRSTYAQLERYETTFLASIPQEKTVVIKDVKSSGTDGGTFTSGSYQTRDLNTIEGDSDIVSLSSNQFVLQPGTYNFECVAPAFRCSTAKSRLQNITDASTVAVSQPTQNNTSSGDPINNHISTQFTITAEKTFEVQHRCNTTRATNGFGLAASFGDDEVYTQLKIRKLVR